MKKIIPFVCLIFISSAANGQSSYDHYYNFQSIDANNIILRLNNHGDFDSPPASFWQITNDQIVFDQGLWVIGKIDNFPHAALSYWVSYYSPGPIIDGRSAMLSQPGDSLSYRIYKINKDDDTTNPDYNDWPAAWGAPINEDGSPKIFGDQSLWAVYNGFDETLSRRNRWNTRQDTLPPTPIEVQQLAFSRHGNETDSTDIFSNVIFFEWTIINKGSEQIDSAFIGLWSDIDFFNANNNNPAVDATLQLGYCWSGTDIPHGTPGIPPAVGYTILFGPITYDPDAFAVFKGRKLNSFKNLPITSFHPIADDSDPHPIWGAPYSLSDIWNIARGFDKNGNIIINPITNLETKFPGDGDPVTNAGWLIEATGGGSGFVMFSGPFNIAPGDTQWIMAALVPGLGHDRFSSITAMKEKVKLLHSLPYDSLAFGINSVMDVGDQYSNLPEMFYLSQNYPNPFNPTTTISYALPSVETPYMASTMHVTLKVFDILGREVATLVNEEKKPGTYKVEFDGRGLSSGVYFYKLEVANYIETKKMVLIK